MANRLKETRRIYSNKSIYHDTPIINRRFLGFYVDRDIGISGSDEFIELESRHNYRPDILSYDLYGTEKYWWIFPRMNMDLIKDPIKDFKEGLVIRVPTSERLKRSIAE